MSNYSKTKETVKPRVENIECHFGAHGEWRDWFKEDTMKANPLDPHHVILDIIKDLHSTNLTRQNQILQLREDVRKEISNSAGYGDLKKSRTAILEWIIKWRDSKSRKMADWVQLIDQIYSELTYE